MKKALSLCSAIAVCLGLAAPVRAGLVLQDGVDIVLHGDTSNGGTFNRPIANGDLPPDTLSGFADSVLYDIVQFEVTSSGVYNFLVTPDFPYFWPTYLFLYQDAFDPGDPLTNVLLGNSNDDSSSTITTTLNSGGQYVLVVTGFSNFDFGAYTDHITDADLLAAPEPPSEVLLVPALLCIAAVFDRRRARC